MSKRTILFATGILVTPLIFYFLLAISSIPYNDTKLSISLFPYAGAEMNVERLSGIYGFFGDPSLFSIFLAVVQYPVYGWLLGGALDKKKLTARAFAIFGLHLALLATLLISYPFVLD